MEGNLQFEQLKAPRQEWPAPPLDVRKSDTSAVQYAESSLLPAPVTVEEKKREAAELRKELEALREQRNHLSKVADALESHLITDRRSRQGWDFGQVLYTFTASIDGLNFLIHMGQFLATGNPAKLVVALMWGFCSFCFATMAVMRRKSINEDTHALTPEERDASRIYSEIERTAKKHRIKEARQIESLRAAKTGAIRDEVTELEKTVEEKTESLRTVEEAIDSLEEAQLKSAMEAPLYSFDSLPAVADHIRETVRREKGVLPYQAAVLEVLGPDGVKYCSTIDMICRSQNPRETLEQVRQKLPLLEEAILDGRLEVPWDEVDLMPLYVEASQIAAVPLNDSRKERLDILKMQIDVIGKIMERRGSSRSVSGAG